MNDTTSNKMTPLPISPRKSNENSPTMSIQNQKSSSSLQVPGKDMRRASIVSFKIDDCPSREERRPTIISMVSNLANRSKRTSMSIASTLDYNQTKKGMGFLVLMIFVFIVFVIIYNWSDHILNLAGK